MIDGGAALALDRVAVGVFLSDDEQLFIERVDNRCIDSAEANAAQLAPIFEHMAADQPETGLVIALLPDAQLRVPEIGAIFGENPIQRSEGRGRRHCVRFAARAPGIERGQQHGLGALHRLRMVGAERLILDWAPGLARPHRHIEEIGPAALDRFAQDVTRQRKGGARRLHMSFFTSSAVSFGVRAPPANTSSTLPSLMVALATL